jgi:acetylornithine deacetylase
MQTSELSPIADQAIEWLTRLIQTPSQSGQESGTAELISQWLESRGLKTYRKHNNVWCYSKNYDESLPTYLFCSHHDTVPAAKSYTRPPFEAKIEDGKIYGLGSNDAGGPLVSLLAAFLHLESNESFNLIFLAAAEEENSGVNGIESVLPELGPIDFAVIGEPTSMKAAICEKGLLVVDCLAEGKTGHAARKEGVNAIDIALRDIEWIHSYKFEQTSEHLGPIHMNVTQIHGGTKHNVIPDRCEFVVDIRITDAYSHWEVLDILTDHMQSTVTPRSTRLKPSQTPLGHKIMQVMAQHHIQFYGSDTMSDQALLTCPSVKMGPGDTHRSHSADEYIFIKEVESGINQYIKIFEDLSTKGETP